MESNERYYRRRAVEERMAAQRAMTEQARAWHAKLAAEFAERAQSRYDYRDGLSRPQTRISRYRPNLESPAVGGAFARLGLGKWRARKDSNL